MRRILDIVLWLPLLAIAIVGAYAGLLAPSGSCGSQNPGLCFGLGMGVAFIAAPLALVCTPIALWRLYKRHST